MSIDGPKKPGPGRPRVDSEPLKLRIEREVLNAIDAFVSGNQNVRTRQSAILLMVESHLIEKGLLKEEDSGYWRRNFADQKGYSDAELRALMARRHEDPYAKLDAAPTASGNRPIRPPMPPRRRAKGE
jgi:hypothetical protein